jgi:signal transduction histidine kinase
LATVSHDLRTPLNGILGIVEFTLKEVFDKTSRESLEILQTSSKLLLNMIDDILDFSMISRGELNINRQNVDICALVKETVKLIEIQAKMKEIQNLIPNEIHNENHQYRP